MLQVLAESVVVVAAGAAAGSVVALATAAGVREVMPHTVPRWDEIGVGWRQLGYALGLAFGGLLLLGSIPALSVSRGASFGALRGGTAQGGRAIGLASRYVLVGCQVALTVVLMFGCLQLVRSAAGLRAVDLGYDPDVVAFRVSYDFQRYPSREARARLYQRIRDRVREVPGVVSVGVVTHLPLSGAVMLSNYQADLTRPLDATNYANYQGVTRGYFGTLGIALVQGRDFDDDEDAATRPVIIVDESLARSAFPGVPDVVGRKLKLGWGLEDAEIVGVVRHARTIEVGREVRPQIYAPIGNPFGGAGIVTVRAQDGRRAYTPAFTHAVASAIGEVGPGRAVGGAVLLTDNIAAALGTLTAVTGLVAFLAVVAGLLSGVGLYLVVAYIVHQRRRATAIRAAIGATPRQIAWESARTTSLVAVVSVAGGAVISLLTTPLIADLLHGVATRGSLSLAAAILIALAALAFGTLGPVRCAARASPLAVLRES